MTDDYDNADSVMENAPLSASSVTPTSEFTCLLDYYASRHAYRYLLHACSTTLTTAPGHPEARFYRAFALTAEQSTSESIRELEAMTRDTAATSDYQLAATAAIIAAHKATRGGRTDKDSLERYKEQLKALSKTTDSSALLTAGRYFMHAHKDKQAKQCLDKLLSKQPHHTQATVYLAALAARTGITRALKKSAAVVTDLLTALGSDRTDINAAMLAYSLYTDRRDYDRALHYLNAVIVAYPNFIPAVLEKSTLLFTLRNYEESLVLNYRVIQRDNLNIFALFHITLYFLVKEGTTSVSAKERLNDLINAIEKCEPTSSLFYTHFSAIVARLTARHKPLLQLTIQMLQQVNKFRTSTGLGPSAGLLIELAYQHYLIDDLVTASSLYQQASKLEDNADDSTAGGAKDNDTAAGGVGGMAGGGAAHMQALIGLIRIKLRAGKWKEASEELEFLSDLTGSAVLSAAADDEHKEREADSSKLEIGLMRATLAYHSERDVGKASAVLVQWVQTHRKLVAAMAGVQWGAPYNHSYDSFLVLQPHLVIELVQLALFLLPSEPAHHGEPPSPLLSACLSVLSVLLDRLPGHLHAHILQAKLHFLAADFTASSASLHTALTLDPTNASAHLLASYLALHSDNFKQSSAELEQARSYDFDVRNTAQYHWIKARLLVASGQLDDAMKVLLAAMDLPGVRKPATASTASTAKRLSGKGVDAAAGSAGGASSVGRAAFPLTDDDRLSVFLELASVYSSLNLLPEASKTMAEAQAAFTSSSSSSSSAGTRLLMAEVDLHVRRKDYDQALSLLRTVDADSSYYTRAKVRMADIFLQHKKNRKAFISAYLDLCTVAPTLHNLLLLAEAHMQVQEPDAAIATYERALDALNAGEVEQEEARAAGGLEAGEEAGVGVSEIYSRIGRAMIATHDYRRAVEYYEEAVRGEEQRDAQRQQRGQRPHQHVVLLLHDLAALFLRIKHHDDAVATLHKALEAAKAQRSTTDSYTVDDIPLLQLDVRSHSLLSQVYRAAGAGCDEQLLASLNTAFGLQSQLLSLLPSTSPVLSAERESSSSLSHQLADYYQAHNTDQNNAYEQAILHYHEALKTNPGSIPSLLSLSQLYFATNDYDAAQQSLVSLLRLQPDHKTASLLLAQLMYERNEHDTAIYHFTQLLERSDDDNTLRYEALEKMLIILKRSGRLTDAVKFVSLCERHVTGSAGGDGKAAGVAGDKSDNKAKAGSDKVNEDDVVHYVNAPGLHYCKGLYYYYINSPRLALIHFNFARKDHTWGRHALYHMIDIYLNPDHLDLFIDAADITSSQHSNHHANNNNTNLMAAERLLSELQAIGEKGHKFDVVYCYTLLASKNKTKQEQAISICTAILQSDNGHVPALLCLANANHFLNQPAKTRNYLKRISKMKLNNNFLQEFEQSYLLLAEIYHEIGKFELSTELCKKVLHLNKSNGKAWEILGGIMEKEAAYRDASENYEQAWYNCGQSNVNIGYKLAFNYLKCRKFVECIDICHAVLKLNPDMPKVRKDVLEKARLGLRP